MASAREFLRLLVGRPVGLAGFVGVLFFAFLAYVAPFFVPLQDTPNIREIYQTPSLGHPLGTDFQGRDTLNQIVYGGRDILTVGFLAAAFSTILAVTLGSVAATLGGRADTIILAITDVALTIPQLILQHRELHKLKSTYIDALPQLVGRDGRVHTSFNQAVAATGRLSSSDPNLQNIPIRTEQGRVIRKAFIADEDNVLISADYSQVELRILAHITQDGTLIETFRRGADIHRATASKIFSIPEDEVTADQRRAMKTINFGVLYGMSAFRLSNELSIPTGQAKDFIEAYFARYPKIQEYLDRTLEEARSTGKVTTLFGRVRYIPEIHNRSFTVRGNAERMATNAPIQGTAADLLKMAMIALDQRLGTKAGAARMLLTVHDEIVIEAPERHAADVAEIVKDAMENIYPLAVPLAVDARWGRSWYDAKD